MIIRQLAVWTFDMSHLGFAGRLPLYCFDTQSLRHINRQIFRHHQTSAVLEKTEVQKTGVAYDTGRMVGFVGHNMCSTFWMVRTLIYYYCVDLWGTAECFWIMLYIKKTSFKLINLYPIFYIVEPFMLIYFDTFINADPPNFRK